MNRKELEVKWSNPTGHLVKGVKLTLEVNYDNQENETKLYA